MGVFGMRAPPWSPATYDRKEEKSERDTHVNGCPRSLLSWHQGRTPLLLEAKAPVEFLNG